MALENINFTIPKGSILGITGPTGGGKSTLTQLIPRFYDVSAGNLFINGVNVRDWPLFTLRQQVASVHKLPSYLQGLFDNGANQMQLMKTVGKH